MKTLETERLTLRDWRMEDAADMLAFYGDPVIWPKAGGFVFPDLDACRRCIRDYEEAQEVWAVTLKDSGRAVGSIFLEDIGRHGGYRELEFVLSGEYHNRGYMTEAVQVVLQFAFLELGLEIVAACHYPENLPSRRVLEKCGFSYEGTLRKYSKNGKDSVRYSITKEEWFVEQKQQI